MNGRERAKRLREQAQDEDTPGALTIAAQAEGDAAAHPGQALDASPRRVDQF